jgi:hypothetical protein
MNLKHNLTTESNPLTDPRLDAALRALGSVAPASGLEGRVLARLDAERVRMRNTSRENRAVFFRMTSSIFGVCGAALACALIVMASVSYSHRTNPVLPGTMQTGGSGVGAASAMHRAAPQPLAPAPKGHGRAHKKSTTADETQKPAKAAGTSAEQSPQK